MWKVPPFHGLIYILVLHMCACPIIDRCIDAIKLSKKSGFMPLLQPCSTAEVFPSNTFPCLENDDDDNKNI